MITYIIRTYLIIVLIASFCPLPKSDNNTVSCEQWSTHEEDAPVLGQIQLLRIGQGMDEECDEASQQIGKCNCRQAYFSLKPLVNCLFAEGAKVEKADHCDKKTCTETVCKKAKFQLPIPKKIKTVTKKAKIKAQKKFFKPTTRSLCEVTPKELFPNYDKLKKETSFAEVWIAMCTFLGILMIYKVLG